MSVPVISPAGGDKTTPVLVTIAAPNSDPNWSIHITKDGTTPTAPHATTATHFPLIDSSYVRQTLDFDVFCVGAPDFYVFRGNVVHKIDTVTGATIEQCTIDLIPGQSHKTIKNPVYVSGSIYFIDRTDSSDTDNYGGLVYSIVFAGGSNVTPVPLTSKSYSCLGYVAGNLLAVLDKYTVWNDPNIGWSGPSQGTGGDYTGLYELSLVDGTETFGDDYILYHAIEMAGDGTYIYVKDDSYNYIVKYEATSLSFVEYIQVNSYGSIITDASNTLYYVQYNGSGADVYTIDGGTDALTQVPGVGDIGACGLNPMCVFVGANLYVSDFDRGASSIGYSIKRIDLAFVPVIAGGSPLYTTPFTVGSNFRIGYENRITVKAIAYNSSTQETSSVITAVYAFVRRTDNSPVSVVEPWVVDEDRYSLNGDVTLSAGNLVCNAPSSWMATYYGMQYLGGTFIPNSTIDANMLCREYDIELSTGGRIFLGFSNCEHKASAQPRKFEFYEDNGNVRFASTLDLLTDFDHSKYITGLRFRVRVAFDSGFKVSVCTSSGVVVATTTYLDTYWLYGNCLYFGSSDGPGVSMGGSRPQGTRDGTIDGYGYGPNNVNPAWFVYAGTAVFHPIYHVGQCTSMQGDEFLSTGMVSVAKQEPSAPVITTQKIGQHTYIVTITPDAGCCVFATLDEGAFVQTPLDVLYNRRRLEGVDIAPLVFTIRKPTVIRAISYNLLISDIVTQYVGDAVDVAIPEIAPSRDLFDNGGSCPVKIYCYDPTAEVRYTLDGSEPTQSSSLYNGTIFINDTTHLRAKSFSGSDSSPTINGLYATSWEDIRVEIPDGDASYWNHSGNASFSGSGILITDSAGAGVSVREDIDPDQSYLDYSGTRFRVSGPFRLKLPGTHKHLAWVGDTIGVVESTLETPTVSFGGQLYADVRIAYGRTFGGNTGWPNYTPIYVGPGYVIHVHGDTVHTEFVLDYVNDPKPVLAFTGEGVSAFTVSRMEIFRGFRSIKDYTELLLSAQYPVLFSDKPVMPSPTNNNIAGLPITVTGSGTTSLNVAVRAAETYDFTISAVSIPNIPIPTDTYALVVARASNTEVNKLPSYSVRRYHGSAVASKLNYWNIEKTWSDHYTYRHTQNLSSSGSYSYDNAPTDFTKGTTTCKVEPFVSMNGYGNDLWAPYFRDIRAGLRSWEEAVLTYPESDMDASNVWYTCTHQFIGSYNIDYVEDLMVTFGFDIDRSISMPVHSRIQSKGAMSSWLQDGGTSYSNFDVALRKHNLNTWLPVDALTYNNGITNTAKMNPIWNCGRKVVDGHLFVRVAVTSIEKHYGSYDYDTGWVDVGVAPSTMPRPRAIIRSRHGYCIVDALHLGPRSYVRGFNNLTEQELDNCFGYGVPSPPAPPVLTIGSTNSDGSINVTVSAPGSDAVVLNIGNREIRHRIVNQVPAWTATILMTPTSDEIFTNDGEIVAVPKLSNIRAYSLSSPYQRLLYGPGSSYSDATDYMGCSSTSVLVLTQPTTDFLSIETLRHGSVTVHFNFPMNYGDATSSYYSHFIVFSDGFRYELPDSHNQAYGTWSALDRDLEPGTYSVWLERTHNHGRYSDTMGRSQPVQFTVSNTLDVSVTAPNTSIINTACSLSASSNLTCDYTWTFSDGTVYNTQSISKTFDSTGRYSWSLVVRDATGEQSMSSGSIVVTYQATELPLSLTKTSESRVS